MKRVPLSPERSQFDHDVFISYRHADGRDYASFLWTRLRRVHIPKAFRESVAPPRVFRDVEQERVTPDLWDDRIRPILSRSRFLLLVLTPSVNEPNRDDEPNWVQRELREFLTLPQGRNVLIVRTSIHAESPHELSERFSEPGWADISFLYPRWRSIVFRRDRMHGLVQSLCLPLFDIPDSQILDFKQQDLLERKKLAWSIASVAVIGLLVMGVLAGWAVANGMKAKHNEIRAIKGEKAEHEQRTLADEQRRLAEHERDSTRVAQARDLGILAEAIQKDKEIDIKDNPLGGDAPVLLALESLQRHPNAAALYLLRKELRDKIPLTGDRQRAHEFVGAISPR